jgi:hypothetical protein
MYLLILNNMGNYCCGLEEYDDFNKEKEDLLKFNDFSSTIVLPDYEDNPEQEPDESESNLEKISKNNISIEIRKFT